MGCEARKHWSPERAGRWVRTELAAGAGGGHRATFSLPQRARCFWSVLGWDPRSPSPSGGGLRTARSWERGGAGSSERPAHAHLGARRHAYTHTYAPHTCAHVHDHTHACTRTRTRSPGAAVATGVSFLIGLPRPAADTLEPTLGTCGGLGAWRLWWPGGPVAWLPPGL